MCGIAGIIGSSDTQLMERMLATIAHRGPDDSGIERFDEVGHREGSVLGHRRLSIIDLSTKGKQPMSNEDGTLWVVFNGEIYNFAELRQELEQAGHVFRSHTDTEVILHGYEQWGASCVERFNGMFAFGLLDTRRGELLLVRDRLGIKPLFYAHLADRFLFASECKAILEDPRLSREVCPQALDLYLALGYVPGPRSIFKNIKKLQPGHMLFLREGQVRIERYWELPSPRPVQQTYDEQVDEFQSLLSTATRDRMVADVPLGNFLSGGLDSSVVTALMAGHLDAGRKPQTFCVGYDHHESRHDESGFASMVADHVGTDHRKVVCSDEYAIESLPRLVWHMDEPVAEDLLSPYARLCEFAREHVTVVLSGEGADEFLYGYRYYCLDTLRRRTGLVPKPIRAAGSALLGKIGSRDNLRLRAMLCCLKSSALDSFAEWSTLFSQSERRSLYGDAFGGSLAATGVADEFAAVIDDGSLRGTDFAPAMDARYRMVDYILSRTDRLSMAVGLEARVPFLDHRIVEFLARVPVDHKIRGFEGKQLLRSVGGRLLPDEIVHRRKKPFGAPVKEWLAELSKRYLADSALVADGLIHKARIRALCSSPPGVHGATTKLWALIVLELWYLVYIRRDRDILDRIEARKPKSSNSNLVTERCP